MTATIHYLRPFQHEDLAPHDDLAEPAQAAEPEITQDSDVAEDVARTKPDKRGGGRAMPCGRNSKWKKKIGGGVVARDKRP